MLGKIIFAALLLGNAAFVPITFPPLAALTVLVLGAGAMAWPVAGLLEALA